MKIPIPRWLKNPIHQDKVKAELFPFKDTDFIIENGFIRAVYNILIDTYLITFNIANKLLKLNPNGKVNDTLLDLSTLFFGSNISGANGYIKFPCFLDGVQRTMILKFGTTPTFANDLTYTFGSDTGGAFPSKHIITIGLSNAVNGIADFFPAITGWSNTGFSLNHKQTGALTGSNKSLNFFSLGY